MNIHYTLNEVNDINPKLKFTIQRQTDYIMNFLDPTIINHNCTIDCSIFHKPTAADAIIHSASCHFIEHKPAAIRYLIDRVNTYTLSEENKTTNKYKLSKVYQLKCGKCPYIYTGQTGQPVKTQYKEHIREIKNNGENSKVALHIQNTRHICTNLEETLHVLHVQHKGGMMNMPESYHIYKANKQGITLNETLTEIYNPIFEIISKNRPNNNPSTTYNQVPSQPP
ncbi:hypothetical protein B7P43_G00038 [Cryptotermes secundus]|uniref:GIY-YIG domain-containing protein n=1 Tax=Cryptotermes secundus TaxID=105785 RepID=A0A2J7NKH2_9NEOP|nr:hypothetical protein B7P43_G00038 [Cryptotermes secundus]